MTPVSRLHSLQFDPPAKHLKYIEALLSTASVKFSLYVCENNHEAN